MSNLVLGNSGQADGASKAQQNIPWGMGESFDGFVTELRPRFYQGTYRGYKYSIGCQLTALSAATATVSSLGATAQPIVGIWNPSTSGINAVLNQAMLRDVINNVSSVAVGDFVWCGSVGNTGNLTAGLAPYNRKTGASTGSACKAFALSTASLLTGLTNTLAIIEPGDFNLASSLLTTTVTAATMTPGQIGVQNFDGSWFVPPGGVLALMNTVSSTTHSVSARLMWDEVPV